MGSRHSPRGSHRGRPEASRLRTMGLEQQNANLRERLQDAETRLAIQARASRILGLALAREAEEHSGVV